mmetsp:Transcript_55254/g.139618  ORF Transcript_55254/g.139618 Transcript_55254/m.139618 type:complete len:252 (-) Transcript_55254:179-934(-)
MIQGFPLATHLASVISVVGPEVLSLVEVVARHVHISSPDQRVRTAFHRHDRPPEGLCHLVGRLQASVGAELLHELLVGVAELRPCVYPAGQDVGHDGLVAEYRLPKWPIRSTPCGTTCITRVRLGKALVRIIARLVEVPAPDDIVHHRAHRVSTFPEGPLRMLFRSCSGGTSVDLGKGLVRAITGLVEVSPPDDVIHRGAQGIPSLPHGLLLLLGGLQARVITEVVHEFLVGVLARVVRVPAQQHLVDDGG